MSTSVAYLRKRLADIGRHDLLRACESGLVSTYACAEEAGLVKRREVLGTGSPNATKKRLWALSRITRGARPLPKPEPKLEPEVSPKPTQPMFSQATRDVIARLVEAGRADLVIAVTERRLSPFQAARIAERGGGRRRTLPDHPERSTSPLPAPESPSANAESPKSDEPAPEKLPGKIRQISKLDTAPKPKKTAPPRIDVRALIA